MITVGYLKMQNHRHGGILYMKELHILRADYKLSRFLTVHRVDTPTPASFKSQMYTDICIDS